MNKYRKRNKMNSNDRGLFITVEGIDGSGKTTLIKGLVQLLKQHYPQLTVLSTREPGGNMIAEKIREIILDVNHQQLDGKTEALLYAAARRQHLVDNLLPAIAAGNLVICDRFLDSSLAYQGYARALGIDEILRINQFAIDMCYPDLTFYIDIPVRVGIERIQQFRSDEVNRLDLENIDFHERVKEGYSQVIKQYDRRIVRLDGMKNSEALVEEAFNVLIQKYSDYFKV